MEEPISVAIESLKQQIVDLVNNSKLHPFVLNAIFKDLSNQMNILYQNQVAKEKQEYEALLASQVQNSVTNTTDIDSDNDINNEN